MSDSYDNHKAGLASLEQAQRDADRVAARRRAMAAPLERAAPRVLGAVALGMLLFMIVLTALSLSGPRNPAAPLPAPTPYPSTR